MAENPFADLIPGARPAPRPSAPTAVQNRRQQMRSTDESIESANVNQAQGRTALAVDSAVVPEDIERRRADSLRARLNALEAKMRADTQGGFATQDERQTAFNYGRMVDAQNRIARTLEEDPQAAKAPLAPELAEKIPGVGGFLANYITDPERRRVVANQRDMLDAALWLSTGAAYNKEQLSTIYRSYFPQPFDDRKTIEDKREKLNNLVAQAKNRASMGLVAGGDLAGPGGRPRAVTTLRKPTATMLQQYKLVPPNKRREARQRFEAAGYDISGLN